MMYLSDNDVIQQFVDMFMEKDVGLGESSGAGASFVTLKDIRTKAASEGIRLLDTCKSRLEVRLATACIPQKKIKGVKFGNVFLGWRLKTTLQTTAAFHAADDDANMLG